MCGRGRGQIVNVTEESGRHCDGLEWPKRSTMKQEVCKVIILKDTLSP